MKINQNNDIFIYRGETGAIDFKMSQRSDYYVPFLISTARVNPMVCITIGSTRRESKNIVSKQLWIDIDTLLIPKFVSTVPVDLPDITLGEGETLEEVLSDIMTSGYLYQFKLTAEVEAGSPQLHFAYLTDFDVVKIDEYEFTIIMAIDENITLDMTNTDYFYQIELMDTEPMITHLLNIFTNNPALISKLPVDFENTEAGIAEYLVECITVVTKAYPNHWGYRINNPFTSPVASVSNIQMLQPPRRFTVQSVIK
jgi:hypothetical protein